jgi:transposase
MPYSSSLTDKEWEIIEPLLPKKKRTKPPVWSKREILDGVLYQLKNGCNWCDLPCVFTSLLYSFLALDLLGNREQNR